MRRSTTLVLALGLVLSWSTIALPAASITPGVAVCLVAHADPGIDLGDGDAVAQALIDGTIDETRIVRCPTNARPTPQPTPDRWLTTSADESGGQGPSAFLVGVIGKGLQAKPAFLEIGCVPPGRTVTTITWPVPLKPSSWVLLGTKVDAQKLFNRASWYSLYSGNVLWVDPSSLTDDSISFVRVLLESERFVAQVTPPGGARLTATFRLGGIGDALAEVRAACGW